MLAGVCGQGKEFLERLSNGGDLRIRGDIEIEVSPLHLFRGPVEAGEVSGAQKGCRELVFVSECLLEMIIKGSFTCKELEGQVQEDRKLWDVEPLEGRYTPGEIAEMS